MKAFAADKTRTRRSMKIESAIEILSEILGSREEVIAVISTMPEERRSLQTFLQNRYGDGDCIMSRIHLSEEEVYDIFRNIFHNEDEMN